MTEGSPAKPLPLKEWRWLLDTIEEELARVIPENNLHVLFTIKIHTRVTASEEELETFPHGHVLSFWGRPVPSYVEPETGGWYLDFGWVTDHVLPFVLRWGFHDDSMGWSVQETMPEEFFAKMSDTETCETIGWCRWEYLEGEHRPKPSQGKQWQRIQTIQRLFPDIEGAALQACARAPKIAQDRLGRLAMLADWPLVLFYLSLMDCHPMLIASGWHTPNHPSPHADNEGESFAELNDYTIFLEPDLRRATEYAFDYFRHVAEEADPATPDAGAASMAPQESTGFAKARQLAAELRRLANKFELASTDTVTIGDAVQEFKAEYLGHRLDAHIRRGADPARLKRAQEEEEKARLDSKRRKLQKYLPCIEHWARAGALVIEASQGGWLSEVPDLDALARWHSGEDGGPHPLGIETDRDVRCEMNLLTDAGVALATIYPARYDDRCRPTILDAHLNQDRADGRAFFRRCTERERYARATTCRLLAEIIEAKAKAMKPTPGKAAAKRTTGTGRRIWINDYCPQCHASGLTWLPVKSFCGKPGTLQRKAVSKRVNDGRYYTNDLGQVPWCETCREKTPVVKDRGKEKAIRRSREGEDEQDEQRLQIRAALHMHKGVVTRAAKMLGIDRTKFYRLCKDLGIDLAAERQLHR